MVVPLAAAAASGEEAEGAKAVITHQPDILFLDMEMPHVDGSYLLDWISPKFADLAKKPKVIIISVLKQSLIEKSKLVSGIINKYEINNSSDLERKVGDIIGSQLTLEEKL